MDNHELAKKIGVTEDKLARIMRGQEPMSIEFAYKCATALGVSVEQLLTIPDGSTLTELRNQYGLKVADLSSLTGIDNNVIEKIELGELPLTPDIMGKVDNALSLLDK